VFRHAPSRARSNRSSYNYIDNALNAGNAGNEISVDASRRDGWIEVDVRDRGSGHAHATAGARLRSFLAGDVVDPHRFGLGLAIVQATRRGQRR
jgi:K+-sensing histidine kinase KdpD